MAKSITNFVVIRENGIFLNKKFIKNIFTEANIEQSTKNTTIHIYMMVKIAHYTQIHLDYKKIKQFFKDNYNLPYDPFMWNKVFRSASDNFDTYLKKMVYNKSEKLT